MSVRAVDRVGRWREKMVSFRMSPEEADELDALVAMSGLTKQDYIIARLLVREMNVEANSRIYKALRDQMDAIYRELRRLAKADDMTIEMQELIESLASEFADLGNEANPSDVEVERALMTGMERE